MFWDKKKKEETLPDLPPSSRPTLPLPRRLPELSSDREKTILHPLPSFPDSPTQSGGFSQAAIKDAIAAEEFEEGKKTIIKREESESPYSYKAVELNDWSPRSPEVPPKRALEAKPVYIRLDKFYAAKSALNEIREMLTESESLLKRIREVKIREEQELVAWEKEMQLMRARISNVTEDIFERME